MENNNESRDLRLDRLAREVLTLSRNTLLVHLRFLDMALSQLEMTPGPWRLATDGTQIFYSAMELLRSYREDRLVAVRDYLHMVFHCIFHHSFALTLVDRECWDLASDIATESVINDLGLPSLEIARQQDQIPILDFLKSSLKQLTAERIYRWLLDGNISRSEMARWAPVFAGDCHDPWYESRKQEDQEGSEPSDPDQGGDRKEAQGDDSESGGGEENGSENPVQRERSGDSSEDGDEQSSDSQPHSSGNEGSSDQSRQTGSGNRPRMSRAEAMQVWKDIAERMEMDLETYSKQRGDTAGGMMQNLKEVTRERYDYSSFLRKFAVMGEVMKINDDEFDQIFYTYGLTLFKNMPLIEPLEYRDVLRVREFVIAIDTSGSVAGDLVQKFLQKTYNILKQEESFFHKINIHIIQCDAEIQEDSRITSQEEFDRYIQTMQLHGFGGTDFRPVFQYVEELQRQKEFVNLKGMIYFTDGYGVFPEQKPPYPAAFVFVDEEDSIPTIPSWAIRLVLRPDEV